MNLTEERIVRRLDLQAFVNGLAHDELVVMILRNVAGLAWPAIAQATGDGEKSCQHKYRLGLYSLAVWLRSYYGRAGRLRLRRFRQRTRARSRSQWKRGLVM